MAKPVVRPMLRVIVTAVPAGIGDDGASSNLIESDALCRETRACRQDDGALHEVGIGHRPLKRLQAADGAASDNRQPPHVQPFEQCPLRPHDIADADQWEPHVIAAAVRWMR